MAVEDSVAQDQLRAFIERIERMEEVGPPRIDFTSVLA